jgi:hypothetical protein
MAALWHTGASSPIRRVVRIPPDGTLSRLLAGALRFSLAFVLLFVHPAVGADARFEFEQVPAYKRLCSHAIHATTARDSTLQA